MSVEEGAVDPDAEGAGDRDDGSEALTSGEDDKRATPALSSFASSLRSVSLAFSFSSAFASFQGQRGSF